MCEVGESSERIQILSCRAATSILEPIPITSDPITKSTRPNSSFASAAGLNQPCCKDHSSHLPYVDQHRTPDQHTTPRLQAPTIKIITRSKSFTKLKPLNKNSHEVVYCTKLEPLTGNFFLQTIYNLHRARPRFKSEPGPLRRATSEVASTANSGRMNQPHYGSRPQQCSQRAYLCSELEPCVAVTNTQTSMHSQT